MASSKLPKLTLSDMTAPLPNVYFGTQYGKTLDDMTNPGFFWCYIPDMVSAKSPSSYNGILMVFTPGNGDIVQVYVDRSEAKMYTRGKRANNSWTAWNEK